MHTFAPPRSPDAAKPVGRRRFMRKLWGASALLACGCGASAWWYWSRPGLNSGLLPSREGDKDVPRYGFEIVKTYDHDRQAFTQGLVFDEGQFYESTGQYEQSSLRRVELATGKVFDRVNLHRDLFGEGLALVEDELFQVTWREGVCIVYEKKTLREKRRFRYRGEGWGLAFDGKHLIFSDGTATLSFLDPKTFRAVRRVEVKRAGLPQESLNELEYIKGEVWANVWGYDVLVRIDPKNGTVNSTVDLSKLWPLKERPDDQHVLNGIAHDSKKDRLFVTGKYWPKLYEIRLVAPQGS